MDELINSNMLDRYKQAILYTLDAVMNAVLLLRNKILPMKIHREDQLF